MAFLGRMAMKMAPMLGRVTSKGTPMLGRGSMGKPLIPKATPVVKPVAPPAGGYQFKPYTTKPTGVGSYVDKIRPVGRAPPTVTGAGVGGAQVTASPAMAGISPVTAMGTPAQSSEAMDLLKQGGVGLATMFAFNTLFGG